MLRTALIGSFTLLIIGNADAQSERHELGRRLIAFEMQWEKTTEVDARKRALAILPKVTTQFFSLQLGEAGRTLDDARWALLGEAPSAATRWAESLCIVPPTVLHDLAKDDFTVTVKHFYPPNVPAPADLTMTLKYGDITRPVPIGKLPVRVTLCGKGEKTGRTAKITLHAAGLTDGAALARIEATVLPEREPILAHWKTTAATDFGPPTIESLTLKNKAALLERLAGGEIPESDRNVNEIIDELHLLRGVIADKTTQFDALHPGDHTMTLPLPNKQSATVRMFVPKDLDAAKPVPIVVAMHGAGGSENLFFEGYGAGRIVEECRKRGWLLVATRGGFLGSPPVAEILKVLKSRYPIDPSGIFVVGHSMGAGQAAEVAQQHPKLFRGIALLGGAARVRDTEAFARLPLFVGVGTKDQLAFKGSAAFVKSLRAAGATTNLTDKDYPEVEHLAIVRAALPDVFANWDQVLK